MKLELKIELIRRFGSQIVAARHLGIGESRLSHIVRGHAEPSAKERKALDQALGPRVARKVLKQSTTSPEIAFTTESFQNG